MFKIIQRIKRKIIRRIALTIYHEMQSINQEKGVVSKIEKEELPKPYKIYRGFKEIGSNSFFWGEKHQITGLDCFEIGENVHIGDNAFIRAEGGLEIGDNTHISRNLTLYTINHDYNGSAIPYDENMIHKKVIIGRNVWIGMNVCIAPGSIIGDGCIIGIGTTVSGIIPPLSIVTSPKCIVIKQRDENHYKYLEEEGRYGGPNGQLYKWGNNKSLLNVGDTYLSTRSTSTLIDFNGKKAIQKAFLKTQDGRQAFETELKGYNIFQKYNWCPRVLEISDNSITIEYFNPETRLDLVVDTPDELFEQIVWCLFELFYEGYAHRDFHAKNIFATMEGIKLIDFETIEKISTKTDFFESYDITGMGLRSPYFTSNMGILKNSPISISGLFKKTSIEKIKSVLNNQFQNIMYHSSITFKTLKDNGERHYLKNPKIYASFDLLHTKIPPAMSQRNTEKRFRRFGINKEIVEGKRILDIGSNIGATLLNLYKYNPSFMLGLEYDAEKVQVSKKLARYNLIDNVSFKRFDIETDGIELGTFDMIFCLALIEHINNKERLFELLGRSCAGILFFEGNANSSIEYIIKSLKSSGFADIEYVGFSDDEENAENNIRPLFIAKK